MAKTGANSFVMHTLDELHIEDEASFKHVGLYADLKRILVNAKYKFRILPESLRGRWDKALLLNLTFWGANSEGDVLVEDAIDADVVAHVGWHHLAAKFLVPAGHAPSADALFMGEAIASAFDVFLVGRLVGHAPKSSFLASQVPAMMDACEGAGIDEEQFDALLQQIVADPDRAFEDLRALLFDATTALLGCSDAEQALSVLGSFEQHRFAPLLHRYELSNWVLYARAYAGDKLQPDEAVRAFDRELRGASDSLSVLSKTWVDAALR